MDGLISEKIATFINKISFDDLPKEVIEKSKQCLLDVIGVTLYGSTFNVSNISLSLIDDFSAKKEATIIGKKQKTSSFLAAMINGISSHIADYDDYLRDFGHPSSVLISALLPVAETKNSSGRKLLTAFVLGTETGSKLGILMGDNHYKVGFHSTSTVGVVAASIALSKLLELETLQIINAIGIAASSASGIRQNFGTMTKAWHVGHAASMAILSTLLSQKGFESSKEALEGQAGFIHAFQGENKIYPVKELGNPYSIMKIKFKQYPSCAATHLCIDAALKIREKVKNNYENIKGITCEMSTVARSVLIYDNPINVQQGKFSAEYCVAAALLSGELGPDQFNEQYFINENDKLKEIMKKITRKYNPELDEMAKKKHIYNPTKLTISLKNGTEYKDFIEEAKGEPKQPLSWESIEDKFIKCCRGIISLKSSKEIVEIIKNIEKIKNIKELTNKLQITE